METKMLDIVDIINDLASDKDKDGNVISTYEDVKEWLTSMIVPFKNYIIKLHGLNIAGKGLKSDYKKWEEKHKIGEQTFGNYVEFCQAREENKRIWDNWIKTGVCDCNSYEKK